MKLLITTQVVDRTHSNLGFFHNWIEEFARHCEQVHIICLQEGEHSLPPNLHVHSLGKERGTSRLTQLTRFYRYTFTLRAEYDTVFVHMNPEYLVLGGVFWKVWGKRTGLWYVHRSVTLWLRVAALFADVIFTVTPGSIRLRSRKIRAVGHGIDTELFTPGPHRPSRGLRILSVSRIAASKGLMEILDALDVLHARGVDFAFTVIGAPLTPQERVYDEMLRREIGIRPYAENVVLRGAIENRELPAAFRDADVFVNISTTGGFDKVVLESLACGIPAVSSSAPFRTLLEPYGLFVDEVTGENIADALQKAATTDVAPLRAEVEKNHSLKTLIPKILSAFALTHV